MFAVAEIINDRVRRPTQLKAAWSIMWLIPNILIFIALTAEILPFGSGVSKRSRDAFELASGAVNVMNPQQRRPLPEGNWGGDRIRMSVSADSSSIELDCANGAIPGKILVDKNGSFSVSGNFHRRRPGPTRPNEPPAEAAQYIGKVSGDKMSLRITLTSNGSVVGDYVLEKGRNGRIVRCY